MIKCGNCKERHNTVADVRACYEHSRSNPRTLVNPDDFIHIQRMDPVTHEPIGPKIPIPSPSPQQAKPERHWYGGNGGRPLPFPPGRYAILTPWAGDAGKLHFFKIDAPTEGRWKGYVFVKEMASDTEYPVKGERGVQVIDEIAKDARGAMLTYGREIGKCGHCGRTLTDEESRAYGIGPICRGKVSFVAYEKEARDSR